MMLFTFGIELALRPTLGPDEVPDRAPVSYASARTLAVEAHAEGCGGGEDDDEAIYDVNRGLLSDEPMDPEAEPEGTGPARRRYVRPSSNAVVGGVSAGAIEGVTMTLVTDVTDVTARRRRRHPAL